MRPAVIDDRELRDRTPFFTEGSPPPDEGDRVDVVAGTR
jgi:hypothetical protein